MGAMTLLLRWLVGNAYSAVTAPLHWPERSPQPRPILGASGIAGAGQGDPAPTTDRL